VNQKLLNLIKGNKFITRIEIAEKLGIMPYTAKEYLAKLKKEKRLKRVGSDRSGYWEIIE
jgi:ATP-dependent DNA helicase RecG